MSVFWLFHVHLLRLNLQASFGSFQMQPRLKVTSVEIATALMRCAPAVYIKTASKVQRKHNVPLNVSHKAYEFVSGIVNLQSETVAISSRQNAGPNPIHTSAM